MDNSYAVEVFQGPVLAPSRTLGLGGAYAGLAEGVDGTASNVAAPAVRVPFSSHHVDYDLTASVSLPGSFATTDFENRGPLPRIADATNFVYGNAGLMLQVGPFGAAFTIDATSYTLTSPSNTNTAAPTGPTLDARILRAHAIVGWAFYKHQLIVGVGVQGATMNLATGGLPLAPPSGIGAEAGMLLKLDDEPWRLGISARTPVACGVGSGVAPGPDGIRRVSSPQGGEYILPNSAVVPAQITAGIAVQLGPRPLNPRWIDPRDQIEPLRERIDGVRAERKQRDDLELAAMPQGPERTKRQRELDATEHAIRRVEDARIDAEEHKLAAERDARYQNWPRPKVLVVLDAVVTAPVDNAVAISSFLGQKKELYGGWWTVSPRFGIEGEPIIDRFRFRFGGYLEPSLFDGGSARQHFTFGGDIKLFRWDFFGILAPTVWQISFATDLAPRYTNWGLSLGVWR